MLKDAVFFNKDFYNKIKLYGFVKITKDTTIPNYYIEKFIFYLEAHEEKYELVLFSVRSEDEPQFNVGLYEVDNFEIPIKMPNQKINFYLSKNPYIHMSYDSFHNEPYKHDEKNKVAKHIMDKRYNAEFVISEIMGIALIDDVSNKYLLENKDDNSEFCNLYINESCIERVDRIVFLETFNPIETNCYFDEGNIKSIEQLLEL